MLLDLRFTTRIDVRCGSGGSFDVGQAVVVEQLVHSVLRDCPIGMFLEHLQKDLLHAATWMDALDVDGQG